MRPLVLGVLFLTACSADGARAPGQTSTVPPASLLATREPSPTPVAGCEPTRARDDSGVITFNGRIGIGETFAVGDRLNTGTHVLRRGTIVGDEASVRFDQVGNTAPATWVQYSVTATALVSPWGEAAFMVGWKPIAFEDSCWRLLVDGADTGIVLAIGH
jgi:hypothetical protein